MSKYTTITGDTFESIARKEYGTDQESGRIARSNPGVTEPLAPNLVLVIPQLPNAPQDLPQNAQSDDINEVSLSVDGVRFRFWSNISIIRSIDSIDSVSFAAPFDGQSDEFRKLFQPFSYKSVEVNIGGVPIFTGTMMNVVPAITPESKTISVDAYSLPGVMNDCPFPPSAYPLQSFDSQTLEEIAVSVADLFGISVAFNGDPGPPFDRVDVDVGQKVLRFLSDLAEKRKFIIRNTPLGELEFLRSVEPGQTVAVFEQGKAPLISVTPQHDPQAYYSSVTAVIPFLTGYDGGQQTAQNPLLCGIVRPSVFKVGDLLPAEMQTAADSKLGRMFGSAIMYTIELSTWRDLSGNLWEPDTNIQLTAPDAMIYNSYEFLVKSVQFERESDSEIAILTLTLPGAFSGEVPEALPWDF